MIKRLAATAALGLAAGALTLAGPAQAQDDHFPAAGWEVRQIATGDTDWSPAAESQIVDATTVALTKPDGTTGTSIETANLGLDVDAGDTITVAYQLDADATVDAGAVRLFYYDIPDADTLTVGPTATVLADGSGTLEITVGGPATIGTLGLVYDASNPSAGTITFSDLTVAGTTVLFLEPADDSDDQDGGDQGDGGEGGAADEGGELAQTGASTGLLAAGAAGMVAVGGGLYWLSRRRRATFTA